MEDDEGYSGMVERLRSEIAVTFEPGFMRAARKRAGEENHAEGKR